MKNEDRGNKPRIWGSVMAILHSHYSWSTFGLNFLVANTISIKSIYLYVVTHPSKLVIV